MVEMKIRVQDATAMQLAPLTERLDEVIEVGLHYIDPVDTGLHDEVMTFLSHAPSPDDVIAFRPSPSVQAQISALLSKNRRGTVTLSEKAELNRLEYLDLIVTVMKANARKLLDI